MASASSDGEVASTCGVAGSGGAALGQPGPPAFVTPSQAKSAAQSRLQGALLAAQLREQRRRGPELGRVSRIHRNQALPARSLEAKHREPHSAAHRAVQRQ